MHHHSHNHCHIKFHNQLHHIQTKQIALSQLRSDCGLQPLGIKLLRMLQNSPIKKREVALSLSKLQKVSSDGKFRVRSLRVKTIDNETDRHLAQKLGLEMARGSIKRLPSIVDKNYAKELQDMGFDHKFLETLYLTRTQEIQVKASDQKYTSFLRLLYTQLKDATELVLTKFNFQHKTLVFFMSYFLKWNSKIHNLNLSSCVQLLNADRKRGSENSSVFTVSSQCDNEEDRYRTIDEVLRSTAITKLSLCNSAMNSEDLGELLQLILAHQNLEELDISNLSSQSMNRFGESTDLLTDFCKDNRSLTTLKMSNLALKNRGLENIWKGVAGTPLKVLKHLDISNNGIGCRACSQVTQLVKSGLNFLDISANPLGKQFYKNLPSWKNSTLQRLNLSSTGLESEELIEFMEKIEENKALQVLKLDSNDFSHHWFEQLNIKLEFNSSIETLSMVGCNVRKLSPLFQGLVFNRYLKKLNVSHNLVDIDKEDPEKLAQCFKKNQVLTELNIKGCGFTEKMFRLWFTALEKNTTLKSLDLAENHPKQEGAKAFLKLLAKNSKLSHINLEKTQIPIRIKELIKIRMEENKIIRQKLELKDMANENHTLKAVDVHTWDDLHKLERESAHLVSQRLELEDKVEKVDKEVENRKKKLTALITVKREEEKTLDTQLRSIIRTNNNTSKELEVAVKSQDAKIQELKQDKKLEYRLIEQIESKLQREHERISKRQAILQERLRDQKYLQKKNQEDRDPRKSFDNTKSLVTGSKRQTTGKQ